MYSVTKAKVNELISELETIYRYILQDYSFERYEENQEKIDFIYNILMNQTHTDCVTVKLQEIHYLHTELELHLTNELSQLKKERVEIEQKKQATLKYNPYEKWAESYFIDKKR